MDFGFVFNFTTLSSLFLIFGIILIIIEFFYPGFGVFGITGLILTTLAIIYTAKSQEQALTLLIAITLFLGAALLIVLRSVAKGRLSKTLILAEQEADYSSVDNLESFVGKTGKTLTILRPAGIALFDDAKLDVVSEGEFIARDEMVQVVKVEGRKVVIKKI